MVEYSLSNGGRGLWILIPSGKSFWIPHSALSTVFKELHFFCTEIKKIVQIFQRKEKLNHFSTIYCMLSTVYFFKNWTIPEPSSTVYWRMLFALWQSNIFIAPRSTVLPPPARTISAPVFYFWLSAVRCQPSVLARHWHNPIKIKRLQT